MLEVSERPVPPVSPGFRGVDHGVPCVTLHPKFEKP